jgi:nucleoside-diphosphate-sugar epimerase
MDVRKVLITGGAGYVGSTMSRLFLENGYDVRVVDALWFNKDVPSLYKSNARYEFIKGDICDRALAQKAVKGIDIVIHTAAVVGDPASKKYPELTRKINQDASIALIDIARKSDVKGFIFLSTCSNYGISEGLANEDSPLKPLSLYAETKVNVEKYLIDKILDLDWVICRLSTIYGASPRMRFDLTVNDFTLNAFTNKFLDIFLPYTYRPYIHVFDASNVVLNIVKKFDKTKRNIFNVGFNGENYQKIEIAKAVLKFIPETKISITDKGLDIRDYQVDFSKLHKFLDMKNCFRVESGVMEILDLLNSGRIGNPRDSVYYNTSPDLGVLINEARAGCP